MMQISHKTLTDSDVGTFVEHLELIAEISQSFATSLDIVETIQNVIVRIMEYLDTEAVSIFLLEKNETELVCNACAGPVKIRGMRVAKDTGIVGRVVRENTVQLIRDVSNDRDFNQAVDNITNFSTRSILCAPLNIQHRCIGALELINKRSRDGLFSETDTHLITAIASSAALAIHNASMAANLVAHERIKRELNLARKIQQSFLPKECKLSSIYGINVPAGAVSGDFFDFFRLDDGRIYFNLADVSGKGMNAALLMAKTSSLFHCLGKNLHRPGELLGILNNEIYERSAHGMFVTMIGGLFNPQKNEIVLSIAGHPSPLLQNKYGEFKEIHGSCPPLGILPNIDFDEINVSLEEGDMYLYTDGLTEMKIDGTKRLQLDGFKALICKYSGIAARNRLEAILKDVCNDSKKLSDDLTIMLISSFLVE